MKSKKPIKLLASLCLPFSFALNSCGENQDSRISLTRKEGITSTVMLTSAKQLQDITRYDDCMVFVELTGCSYCERTKHNLQTYITETNAVIYEIESNDYKEAYQDISNSQGTYANLYPYLKGYPGLLFYSGGKLVNTYLSSAVKYEQLVDIMNAYTKLSNRYLLNDFTYSPAEEVYYLNTPEDYEETKHLDTWGYSTNDLEKKIQENNSLILYTWRRCHDCIDYRKDVLTPFEQKNPNVKIYFYETEGYMLGKREEDKETKKFVSKLWEDFCNKFHLSDYSLQDEFGYVGGFVPTIVSYKDNSYSLSVFSNARDVKRNENGTLSYSMAFYDEILKLQSDTKVEEGDFTSSKYLKAKKELDSKRYSLDVKLNTQFLEKETL